MALRNTRDMSKINYERMIAKHRWNVKYYSIF